MALLEGMAAGTPIVARKGEGGAELVEEYGAGFLYDPGEGVQPLADSILSVHRDHDRYHALSAQCRNIAKRDFSMTSFGQKLVALYRP